MISQTEFSGAVSTAISLILLATVGRLLWDQRKDNLRDRLFALRDEMFLYALDENISNSDAHMNLRLVINGLIRYAHRVSFSRLLLLELGRFAFRLNPKIPRIYAAWQEGIARLPADQATKLRGFHDRAMVLMLEHMFSGSPVLWAASILLVVKRLLTLSTHAILRNVTSSVTRHLPPLDLLEADALRSM